MTDEPEPPREHHASVAGFGFASMLMSGKLDEAFVERIERVIEHSGQRLNPEMVQQILGSEQFRERLDEASQQRIRAALARVTGGTIGDVKPAELTQEPNASPSASTASAWQPDARTTGDANWTPQPLKQGDDPWHPGGKTDDPWHPGTGSKTNDPWHPGD